MFDYVEKQVPLLKAMADLAQLTSCPDAFWYTPRILDRLWPYSTVALQKTKEPSAKIKCDIAGPLRDALKP